MKTRIYFLDNLRTFMIFLVILYHAGFVYQSALAGGWIVVDPVKNESLGLVGMYLDLFVMFTLFFISGYFLPHSLKRQKAWDYIRAKFNRIMLPWMLAVLTLIPAYKAIFLYSRGLPQEEWFSYFHWFERTGTDLSSFSNNPVQNWLWFLPVLFLFQLAYLALSRLNLLSFKTPLKGAVVLIIVIGLLYSMVISATDLTGWFHSALLHFQKERLLIYFMVFLLGTLCYELDVFATPKNRKYYIASNVILTLSLGVYTVVALNFFFNMVNPERNFFFVSGPIDRMIYYMSVLLSMLAFLYILIHVFRFNLNKSNWVSRQLSNNSYNVYIIHMVVLGGVALALVDLSMPVFIKYLLLTLLTFAVSNALVGAYRQFFARNIILKVTTATTLIVVLFTAISLGGEGSTLETRPNIGLHEATIRGDIEAIWLNIEAGSDPDEREPSGGSSPLITAALFGKTEAALVLIEAGADVNFKNNEGSTPLHTAAFFCRTEIVEVLLIKGADKSIKNNSGSTALGSVTAPFEMVKGYYDYFGSVYGSMGLTLDYEQIETTRPLIAEMLQ